MTATWRIMCILRKEQQGLKEKLQKKLFFCWFIAMVQGISGWIMLSKAQYIKKATGSWMSAPTIIAVGVLLVAFAAIFFAGRYYDKLKWIEEKEKAN